MGVISLIEIGWYCWLLLRVYNIYGRRALGLIQTASRLMATNVMAFLTLAMSGLTVFLLPSSRFLRVGVQFSDYSDLDE